MCELSRKSDDGVNVNVPSAVTVYINDVLYELKLSLPLKVIVAIYFPGVRLVFLKLTI